MPTFQHILFPVDFSEQNAAIAPHVICMARRYKSRVTMLHVVEIPAVADPVWPAYGTGIDIPAIVETSKQRLDAFRRGVREDGAAPDGLFEALAARLSPEAVARRQRRSFVEGRRPIRADAFDQLRAVDELDLETELERRDTVIADLEVDDGEARLSFEGRTLHLPARIAAELEYLLRVDEPFTAADLPGRLDDEGRLVLLRRLVREGLVRIRAD